MSFLPQADSLSLDLFRDEEVPVQRRRALKDCRYLFVVESIFEGPLIPLQRALKSLTQRPITNIGWSLKHPISIPMEHYTGVLFEAEEVHISEKRHMLVNKLGNEANSKGHPDCSDGLSMRHNRNRDDHRTVPGRLTNDEISKDLLTGHERWEVVTVLEVLLAHALFISREVATIGERVVLSWCSFPGAAQLW